jgi:transposase-like protein
MSDFKGRHFEGEIVLWAVRWYCRYGVSYCDLEQMMGERGVLVDHSTIRARYGEKAALAVADAALDKLARR